MSPDGGEGQWRVRVASGEYGPLDLWTIETWVRERRVLPSDFVYSPLSGSWLPAASVPQLGHVFSPQQAVPPTYAGPRVLRAASPYKGVGGWLLFFCVMAVVIAPLSTLYGLVRNTEMIDELLGSDHPLKRQMLVWSLANIPFVAFGLVTGIRLWQVKPGAVRLVKIYLWVNLAAGLAAFAMGPDYTALQKAMARKHGMEMDFALIQALALVWGIVWFLIWFMYFRVSKRVKATYGA